MVRFQLTVDCADPGRLSAFWADALGYVPEPPPEGHDSWDEYWRSRGVEDEGLDGVVDRLADPAGAGPPIWFQRVEEHKAVKNRLHLDLDAGAPRGAAYDVRRERVLAMVEHLVGIGATVLRELCDAGSDFFAVTLADPEGNEFCVH